MKLAQHCAKFRGADNRRAVLQLITTIVPFVAIVTAMFMTVQNHYWATLLLAIPGGLLVVRFFIIQHDCGHGSFFSTNSANTWMGRAMSLLTVTPYALWRREHAQHHATSGHLEKRGVGDIDTLTVDEWNALSSLGKLRYRLYRNPIFLFGVGVPFYFMIIQRFPWFHPYPARDTWKSVLGLNVGLAVMYGALGYFTGYSNLFFVVWPLVHVAAAVGGWLFFIQHQFEETVWEFERRLDVSSRSALRQLVLRAASGAELVHGIYRAAPHPSPEQHDPELSPEGLHQRQSGIADDEPDYAAGELPVREAQTVGFGQPQARDIR